MTSIENSKNVELDQFIYALSIPFIGRATAKDLARYYKDTVFAAMNELRIVVDELETHTSAEYWPYPSYGDILFSVK